MAEQGFPGFEATTWYGLVGPGKLPTAMAQRMNEDVNKVLADARRAGAAWTPTAPRTAAAVASASPSSSRARSRSGARW